jgi:calcineurin-like phosphoesterase family protein
MKGAKKSPPGKEAMEKTLEVDLSTLKGKRVHFISDLHFGHLNIIRYCNRPFRDLEHMEEQMIIKWNEAVEKGDIVFYGGDMAYGKRSKPLEEYLKQLNGKIYYVKGNHDKRKGSPITMYTYIEFSYGDLKFRLVHNPDEWKHYKGWVIHGHHHNNHPVEYPMVSKENRTINVSCELLNYRPMPLQDILDTIWDDKRPTFTLKRGEPHCVL